MQTKKWGPSAWAFVHSAAHKYPPNPTITEKNDYRDFFHCLGTQLPCKYCRESWCIFEKELPIDQYIQTGRLPLWVYLMHNKVNNKLRLQGNPIASDPTFESISDRYRSNSDICTQQFWVFLHAITYNYPENPTDFQKMDTKKFFKTLRSVFPCKVCRELYRYFWEEIPIDMFLESRYKLTYWLYAIHQKINIALQRLGYPSLELPQYQSFCEIYENIRAQCSNAKKTCSAPPPKV